MIGAAMPFYQFGGMSVIYCQKWYGLNLTDLSWDTGDVEGSTSSCPLGSDITDEQVFHWIVEHLRQNGFDVFTLEDITPWLQ